MILKLTRRLARAWADPKLRHDNDDIMSRVAFRDSQIAAITKQLRAANAELAHEQLAHAATKSSTTRLIGSTKAINNKRLIELETQLELAVQRADDLEQDLASERDRVRKSERDLADERRDNAGLTADLTRISRLYNGHIAVCKQAQAVAADDDAKARTA